VKLVLALTWQVASHQRRDGGPTGYPQVMEKMRYERFPLSTSL
jgi:hypothetical protein